MSKLIKNKTEEFKEYLICCFKYFEILNKLNKQLQDLIKNNSFRKINENEDEFYKISTQILRLCPYTLDKVSATVKIVDSGIFLIKKVKEKYEGSFYKVLVENNETLIKLLRVRNKYIHEAHNIRWGFTVGGNTSCSIGFIYKDENICFGTTELTKIIYEFNILFDDIFQEIKDEINDYELDRTHPFYINISKQNFLKYNKQYEEI